MRFSSIAPLVVPFYDIFAAAESASGPSPCIGISSKYSCYNLTQQIDHNNSDSGNFNQRFQLVADFFKPGGPILFLQGPESALSPIENDFNFDAAQELGGLVVTLEHRYFGTSLPNTLNGTAAAFTHLTLENVLSDAVAFVNYIKKNVTGAAESKVIVTGGSYAGNLALAMRVKHGDTFFGAFPSGAITESFGPLANDTVKFKSAIQLHNIYFDASTRAASKIQAAMLEFYNCAYIGRNCSTVISQLGLCSGTPNATQWITMYQTVLNGYRSTPMFNYPMAAVYGVAYPFQYLLDATENATNPGEVLRIPLAMANWQQSLTDCVDWTSPNISGMVNVGPGTYPSYTYLYCQYYPINELAIPPGNLLPSNGLGSRVDTCSILSYQGKNYNQTDGFWRNYLGTSTDILENTTRLVITQNGFDRTTGIGSPVLRQSDDREHSRVIYSAGLGHTEDMFPESIVPRGTLPELDLIRDTKIEVLKDWLGYYNATNLWAASDNDTLPNLKSVSNSDNDLKHVIVNNDDDNNDDKSHKWWSNLSTGEKVGVIIGIVVGVIVLIACIWLIIFCWCLPGAIALWRKQSQQPRSNGDGIPLSAPRWQPVQTEDMLRPGFEPYRSGHSE